MSLSTFSFLRAPRQRPHRRAVERMEAPRRPFDDAWRGAGAAPTADRSVPCRG